MRLSISAFRPLPARVRVTSSRRLSSSIRLSQIKRYQHHMLVGNDQSNEDDDDDDRETAMQEDDEPGFQNKFFPVKLGQVFEGRYRTIQKIYWNRSWTQWFCLDQRTNRYVALKVSTAISTDIDDHPVTRELQNYRHIQSITSTHPGRSFILPLLHTFDIPRSDGKFHRCLIHPSFVTAIPGYTDIKSDVYSVLQALDFLHTANITHCRVSPFDVTRGVQDERVFDGVNFQNDPVQIKGHPVYSGHAITVAAASYNLPTLSGLEYSRIGPLSMLERIQPPYLRAPEVVLQTGNYSHAIDIWNLGCSACSWENSWDPLFFPYGSEEGYYSTYLHLAQMISLLGPPPRELLAKSPISDTLFNDDRCLKLPAELDRMIINVELYSKRREWTSRWGRTSIAGFATTEREAYPRDPLPIRSLARLPCVLNQDEKDRDHFVDFIRRTLAWRPEQRDTAAELLQHPWLKEFRPLGVFSKMYCELAAYGRG